MDANQPPKKFYGKPWLGQPFKLRQNEVDVEYAAIAGVRVTGRYINEAGEEADTWAACLKSPLSHEFRFYHNTHVGDWVPLTAQEMADLRGAAVLGDVVDKATFLALAARVASLENDRLAEEEESTRLRDRLVALEKWMGDILREGKAAAPPAEQTSGRPARVQTAGSQPQRA